MLIALTSARLYRYGHTQHTSFTAGTTGVSNPVRSPGFRASASDHIQQTAFATGILPDIYAFLRYTRNSVCLSVPPVSQFRPLLEVKPQYLTNDLSHRLRALYAQ